MAKPKKRTPIGRRLDSSNLNLLRTDGPKTQTYILASGERAEFYPLHIPAEELESKTLIDEMINIREQRAITTESLSDICETLQFQQFFPAIGRKLTSGLIEILDGSRRRMAALQINKGLDLLVTNKQISSSDAHALATSIQTAQEHSIREIGLRLQAILEQTDITQLKLAKKEGLSASKVTRALQAAKVPFEFIELFPRPSLLAHTDYRLLLSISESTEDLGTLVEQVREAKSTLDPNKPEDTYKALLLKLIKECSLTEDEQSTKPKTVVKSMWDFSDRNAFARRRSRERQVNFEFNRLPLKLEKKVETAILSILEEHYGNEA
jgi:ParB family transcriptional regulator, chromosome partitioning protein